MALPVPNSNTISKTLEELVRKRQQQIAYLRRTHEPDVDFSDLTHFGQSSFWLNSISVSPYTINLEMQNENRKIGGWFCLGTSLSKLLDIDNATVFCNTFIQLMEEFSYRFGNRMHASFSYFRAKNLQEKFDINANTPIKPIIWKRANKVVFQTLDTPRLPQQLNYCMIVYSMLSILYLLYGKFLNAQVSTEVWRKAIVILDEKIKDLVLKDLTDVLTKLTTDLMERQINEIMPKNETSSSAGTSQNVIDSN